MNVLMGLEPLAEMDLTDSISTILPMPAFIGAETALNVRPDYAISQLDVDYQKRQVSLAAAKYNPSLSIGFKETWGTQMLNISGETMFNSNVYASIKLPISIGEPALNRRLHRRLFYWASSMHCKISKTK